MNFHLFNIIHCIKSILECIWINGARRQKHVFCIIFLIMSPQSFLLLQLIFYRQLGSVYGNLMFSRIVLLNNNHILVNTTRVLYFFQPPSPTLTARSQRTVSYCSISVVSRLAEGSCQRLRAGGTKECSRCHTSNRTENVFCYRANYIVCFY